MKIRGNLTLSLVAVMADEIIGHVAFSPATIGNESEGWYALGPISVTPGRQRKGVGSALIKEGLNWLKAHDAKGCVLTGNPDYYGRFGFQSDSLVTYLNTATKYVQWLPFPDFKSSFGQLYFWELR